MKTYYINLTFDDLTFPDPKSYSVLFRPLDFRFDYWWLRFCRNNGTGLTAITDDRPLPHNVGFIRFELATIIGVVVKNQLYGSFTNKNDDYYLRAITILAQDPPVGTPTKLTIYKNGVNTGVQVQLDSTTTPGQERFQVFCLVPIKLDVGDTLQIYVNDVGIDYPGQNWKVFGIFAQ